MTRVEMEKNGFYKVSVSGGNYVVGTFYNPITKETITERLRDYDYADCSRDNDDLYYMDIDNEVKTQWLHDNGVEGETMRYRYIIKITYLTGQHKGRTYLMTKGGYITGECVCYLESETYSSLRIAERYCRRLTEDNKINYSIETNDRNKRIEQGKIVSGYRINELQKFEPYPVETF